MDALPPGSSGKPALADPAVVATQLANAQLERLSTAWGTHKWGEEGGGQDRYPWMRDGAQNQAEWPWRAKAYTYPPNAHMLFYQPTFLTIQQSSVCANKSEPLATT